MLLSLVDLTKSSVLAGTDLGREVLGKLLTSAGSDTDLPELFFLDFTGIDVATASFLREAVLGFRNAVRGRRSNLYPVIANASVVVLDELKVLTETMGDVLLICSVSQAGSVSNGKLLGRLDPKQQITFDLVSRRGEADAAELMRDHQDAVGQTAWNNRLAALANLGLLFEFSQGRAKRYKAIFPGGRHGD
jgi:hypothetical protein